MRDALIWAALLAVAVVAARAAGRLTSAARWAISVAACATAAMTAATVVWRLHGDDAVRVERSKLAMLSAFRRSVQTTLVDVSELRVATPTEVSRALTFEAA